VRFLDKVDENLMKNLNTLSDPCERIFARASAVGAIYSSVYSPGLAAFLHANGAARHPDNGYCIGNKSQRALCSGPAATEISPCPANSGENMPAPMFQLPIGLRGRGALGFA
jgi:hypothetical protein